MLRNLFLAASACVLFATVVTGEQFNWTQMHAVEKAEAGFKTTASGAWMLSEPLEKAAPAARHCVLVEMKADQPAMVSFYWRGPGEEFHEQRCARFHVRASKDYQLYAANLDNNGQFAGLEQIRLHPGHGGVSFDIGEIRFVGPGEIPEKLLPQLIEFRGFTSKRHYLPGEQVEYQVTMQTQCYPDRQSSKVLEMTVFDKSGVDRAHEMRQYGIRSGQRFKTIQGVLEFSQPLEPGPYTLRAVSRDQRSGLKLVWRHEFGVLGENDPYLYETPFKFVKDFSVVRGPKGRLHVFSITGDLFGDHGWSDDGQERTFSHASSEDLRHWEIHPPVISISNDTYPDGKGRFKDRNVWAPHVIKHDGEYWMFYTSVNQHVSQSISLARSKNLFEWEEYEDNPVFTLEGVDWAHWRRDRWGDCRDPVVLKDGGKFYLYVTASAKGPGERGAIGVAESDDLIHWKNPQIAVRGYVASESPQVWKDGDTYCMTTSSHGVATYTSKDPVSGWQRTAFPRPEPKEIEKHVNVGGGYAEEVVRLDNGEFMMASLTFGHHGNTIYFFRMKTKDGLPIGYESPW